MSLPTSYDAIGLGAYMATVLGKTGTALGWETADDYAEAVNDALLLYGRVTDIAEATDIEKLRACARLAVWQAVEADTVAYYDLTMPDGIRAERNQIHQQSVAMVKRERARAMRHGVGFSVTSTAVTHANDPFVYQETE